MLRLDHFLPRWRAKLGKKKSWARRMLGRLGKTVEFAPVRRAIQTAAFLVFLALVFWVSWPYDARPDPSRTGWPSHYADNLATKEFLPVEGYLAIDPLVALSTAVAARTWVWSLASAAGILILCMLVPRGFCGYLCPLGTMIDMFDWAVGRRVKRFKIENVGHWRHLRYLILAATIAAAFAGVMLAGVVAAIPIITRGMSFAVDPLVHATASGWHAVPPPNWGHLVSLTLFGGVLALGLLSPRFWCKYVCPSGAVFSVANSWRVVERKVSKACIGCNQCVEACPFDAINTDWSTRVDACTLCQTCAGACPTQAITFVGRTAVIDLKPPEPEALQPQVSRRALLTAGLTGAMSAVGVRSASAANDVEPVLRPPGSVPEPQFLQQCIRCDACLKVCPNDVLQPLGFERGLNGLWTPALKPDWAGCDPSCNACGQACPTGAIRALPLEEKRHARIGLAAVDTVTCLPWAGSEACQLCVDECRAAGYDAIEFQQVHTEMGPDGNPIDGTGFIAPVVVDSKCVGCGLCQTRCNVINVNDRGVLSVSAIVITAGEGREDRLTTGSYKALREAEAAEQAIRKSEQQRAAEKQLGDFY
ncbi:MAG: 4Fe-4S binding protein [Planctomycetes bacterium]|nr:4Fe-4S binding protein [Planctomycetota bacterium]